MHLAACLSNAMFVFFLPPIECVRHLPFLQKPLLRVRHTIMAMMRVSRMMTPSRLPTTPKKMEPETEKSPASAEGLLPAKVGKMI